MSTSLLINGQTQRFDAETISVGRGGDNTISLPDDERLAPVHAVLRVVAGRWIVESKDGGPVQVGNGRPTRFAWIGPGDVIRLSDSGPEIVFDPGGARPLPSVIPAVASHVVPTQPDVGAAAGPAKQPAAEPARNVTAYIVAAGVGVFLLIGVGVWLGGKGGATPPQSDSEKPAVGVGQKDDAPAQPRRATVDQRASSSSAGPPAAVEMADPELLAQFEDSVVWIGLKQGNYTFVEASGWIVRGNAVITSAAVVAQLAPIIRGEKGDWSAVVHSRGRTISVKDSRLHPDYDVRDPGNQTTSVPHNVGALILTEPFSQSGLAASSASSQKLLIDAAVRVIAFESLLNDEEPYNEAKVTLKVFHGRIEEVLQTSPESAPAFLMQVPIPKSARGAPVFDKAGKIVGTLAQFGGKTTLIPAKEAFRIHE